MGRARAVAIMLALGVSSLGAGAAPGWAAQDGPNIPQPGPVTLDPQTTALLVLDLSTRCNNPQEICSELVPHVARILPKARASSVFTVFVVSAAARGTPLGDPWGGFQRQPEEPVIYPDGFDKFVDGELHALLRERGIKTVIITGASAHVSVLYTASTAARIHGYEVVIPLDGMISARPYEHQYTVHQFTVLPAGVADRFRFTTLDMVEFAGY